MFGLLEFLFMNWFTDNPLILVFHFQILLSKSGHFSIYFLYVQWSSPKFKKKKPTKCHKNDLDVSSEKDLFNKSHVPSLLGTFGHNCECKN